MCMNHRIELKTIKIKEVNSSEKRYKNSYEFLSRIKFNKSRDLEETENS